MHYLNPYVHTCVDQPMLVCPACKWAKERQTADVLVYDEGTIWLFNPLSERAKAWVADHVAAESWQWLCDALAVEHRYAPEIVEAMLGDELVSRGPRRRTMTWTGPLWSKLKVTGGVTDELLRLVSEPILEPPHVDVGDAGGAN